MFPRASRALSFSLQPLHSDIERFEELIDTIAYVIASASDDGTAVGVAHEPI